MKFKSLKTKILFYFGAVTTIILILFNIAFYHFLEQNTKLSIQNKLYNKAVFINRNIMSNIPIDKLLEDDELKSVDVAIIKEDKIIFKKGNVNFNKFKRFQKKKNSFFVFEQDGNLDGLYVLRVSNPFKGAILFYEHKIDEQIEGDFKKAKNVLMVLEPILLFLLIFAASKGIDKILRTIKDITITANKIYVTDLSQKIPQPKYDDEIKDLVDSFNSMTKRLKDGVELLEQFNSDVSHELKTPLTVIKGEIEVTLNKLREPDYYINSLKTIEDEAIVIQEIVDNLLLLTKYTKENIEQTFQETNIDSILLSSIDKFNIQLKNKNIKLHLKKFESISLNVNPILITAIFSNLIDNAIKYSLNDKNIYISLFKKEDKTHFIIKDEGVGVPEEQVSKITDRFYRVDESRNKKIKGFGLGLSIVRNSIELHNGTINIDSQIDVGTTIEVIL